MKFTINCTISSHDQYDFLVSLYSPNPTHPDFGSLCFQIGSIVFQKSGQKGPLLVHSDILKLKLMYLTQEYHNLYTNLQNWLSLKFHRGCDCPLSSSTSPDQFPPHVDVHALRCHCIYLCLLVSLLLSCTIYCQSHHKIDDFFISPLFSTSVNYFHHTFIFIILARISFTSPMFFTTFQSTGSPTNKIQYLSQYRYHKQGCSPVSPALTVTILVLFSLKLSPFGASLT